MEQLKEALVGCGVAADTLDGMDKTQIKNLAKAFNLNPAEFLPRNVEITEYKGAQYIKTEGFPVPHKSDPKKSATAKNLFLRVEAVDQAITDLLVAKGLLDAE